MTTTEGSSVDGYQAVLITLRSEQCTAVVTDVGARLLELHVPDRDGQSADVVLARPTLSQSLADPTYMGSTAGRYANRIRRGRFTLDGREYQLATNEGVNHLHGGLRGFDQYAWSTQVHDGAEAVTFTRVSPDGEEGYPGRLEVATTYALSGNALSITMTATTDAPTIVNLVNHSYLNLAGHASGSVLDHVVSIEADHYTPVDDEMLPTGDIASVRGTPFDFTQPRRIGDDPTSQQLFGTAREGGGVPGYDHDWVLRGTGMRPVAVVTDPSSGRRVELATNQPGLQFYIGGGLAGVSGKAPVGDYEAFAGLTLETQGLPGAPNQPHFPSSVLRPGQVYENRMVLTFTTA